MYVSGSQVVASSTSSGGVASSGSGGGGVASSGSSGGGGGAGGGGGGGGSGGGSGSGGAGTYVIQGGYMLGNASQSYSHTTRASPATVSVRGGRGRKGAGGGPLCGLSDTATWLGKQGPRLALPRGVWPPLWGSPTGSRGREAAHKAGTIALPAGSHREDPWAGDRRAGAVGQATPPTLEHGFQCQLLHFPRVRLPAESLERKRRVAEVFVFLRPCGRPFLASARPSGG